MIFAISAGTDGHGPERFVLYLPFEVAPGRTISAVDPAFVHRIGRLEVRLQTSHHYFSLTLGPFDTEFDAENSFAKLRSSFLWVSLKERIGISYPKSLDKVTLYDAPAPVIENSIPEPVVTAVGWDAIDGDYNADEAVVRPEDKRLLRFEMGRASVTGGVGSENFLSRVAEALEFRSPEKPVLNKKLQLAIDLYSSFFFEMSDAARFITLVTTLEALTPETYIGDASKKALAEVMEVMQKSRDKFEQDSIEWKELEHLLNRTRNLKKQAIGTGLREYICGVVDDVHIFGDSLEIRGKLRDAYDCRSTLLHTGTADEAIMKESLEFLRNFVPQLLEYLYILEAK